MFLSIESCIVNDTYRKTTRDKDGRLTGYNIVPKDRKTLTADIKHHKKNIDLLESILDANKGDFEKIEGIELSAHRYHKFYISPSKDKLAEIAKKCGYWCECCERTKPGLKLFLEKCIHYHYDFYNN